MCITSVVFVLQQWYRERLPTEKCALIFVSRTVDKRFYNLTINIVADIGLFKTVLSTYKYIIICFVTITENKEYKALFF